MPPQDIEISELEREILIRVGSPNGPHVLSWEVLKKVGNSLEALFLALVKNSQMLNIKTVDADALKLQFSGFYEGSAVPAFKLASKSDNIYSNNYELKKEVIRDFKEIMSLVNQGEFSAISNNFRESQARNEIIKKVYSFTNSAGDMPLNVVRRLGKSDFEPVYRIRKIPKTALPYLLDNLVDDESDTTESTAVARMLITKDKGGKVSQKPSEVYEDDQAVLSLKLDKISYLGTHYTLYVPVMFQIYQEGGGTIIENEQLDIVASGKTISDARISLYSQFDYTYNRFNELKDDQLSNRLLRVKQYLNSIIKSVKQD